MSETPRIIQSAGLKGSKTDRLQQVIAMLIQDVQQMQKSIHQIAMVMDSHTRLIGPDKVQANLDQWIKEQQAKVEPKIEIPEGA